MTKEELKNIIDDESIFLIDIREPEELEVSPALPQANHMPLSELMTEPGKFLIPKDKKVISVCQSGGRCLSMTKKLQADGYEADFLEGGMNAWYSN